MRTNRLVRIVIALLLSITGTVLVGVSPAAAGLSQDRRCVDINAVGYNRLLSICARAWVSDPSPIQSRGVVEMHTYILVNGRKVDSTSQSITINKATYKPNTGGIIYFGNDYSSETCRVNGASSSQIACSVPNTGRVAFYGRAFNGISQSSLTCIYRVSWRDDRGIAFYVEDQVNHFALVCYAD